MRLKSYFAASVETAMNLAAQELGTDAMLVHSRRSTAEARHLGEYEVVFAASPKESVGGSPLSGNDARAATGSRPQKESEKHPSSGVAPNPGGVLGPEPDSFDRLSRELGDLKRQIERIAERLQSAPMFVSTPTVSGLASAELMRTLLEAEVEPQLAHELIVRAASQGNQGDIPPLEAALGGVFNVDATLGNPHAKQRIAALIGPPGVGKTATLVKLAARYGLVGRRPAQIISMDVFRIAASEQLRACAAILGVGFQTAETTLALDQALEEHGGKELILIDTPGFSPAEIEDASELARFFSTRKDIDSHLVLPATLRTSDLLRTADRFQAFGPSKLLFTRIDETDCFGPILNLMTRTGNPVSFLTSGQRIPEDLEAATTCRLSALLARRQAGTKPSQMEQQDQRAGQRAAAA